MSVTTKSVSTVIIKVIGTVVLAAGFILFVGQAPFLASGPENEATDGSAGTEMLLPRSVQLGNMQAPVLPSARDIDDFIGSDPTLGLFNAQFFAVGENPGFTSSEHRVPGSCEGAGRRHIASECPDCEPLIDHDADGDMLLWHQPADETGVVRSVSKDCIANAADGTPIVGSLIMGGDELELTNASVVNDNGTVPLLPGATRIAALNLGAWSATYDEIVRPSTAMRDMTNALQGDGWREVSSPETLGVEKFEAQRVFTNPSNEICVITLSRSGTAYQLVTVINSRV